MKSVEVLRRRYVGDFIGVDFGVVNIATSNGTKHSGMNAEMAAERRERFDIADPTFAHGVSLNDLDGWDQAHRRLTNSAARLA